jgi:hypothetical protein
MFSTGSMLGAAADKFRVVSWAAGGGARNWQAHHAAARLGT